MKRKKIATFTAVCLSFSLLAGCSQERAKTYFTVSFDTAGGSQIDSIQVEKAHLITAEIAKPSKTGYSFVNWCADAELAKTWDFQTDVVNEDMTLYASYRMVSTSITDILMEQKAFSSKLTFFQSGVNDTYSYTVDLYPSNGTDTEGKLTYGETATTYQTDFTYKDDAVTLTLKTIPTVGFYKAEITPCESGVALTTSKGTAVDLEFKGEGTKTNPYGVFEDYDFYAISKTEGEIGKDKYYKQMKNVSVIGTYEDTKNSKFAGYYDGNGCNLNLDSSNSGAFYLITSAGTVTNLKMTENVSTANLASVGGLADYNEGLVSDVTLNDYNDSTKSSLISTAGTVGDISTLAQGGAGSLVGTNKGTIKNVLVYGNVKANIGGGSVAGVNYGTIENADNRGTIGAGNAIESGKSLSKYSYGGGIAGVNYGTISRSRTDSIGKLLAQRYTSGTPSANNNKAFGGIAGLNGVGGVITESFFTGIRCHADEDVGGIAGINEGTISYCYANANYFDTTSGHSYIAGRTHVGGIVGLNSGTVTNCFNAADVYVYTAGEKAYGIASSAVNSVSVATNFDLRATGTQTYGNTVTDALSQPETGSDNTSFSPSASEYQGIDFLFPDYTVLLGDKFTYTAATGLVLAWQA